ncbi:MAG TPA: hypothetical protein VHC22_14825 [Pirellulales bacterium]|nr:hypothetical protein [Pirellulales bacterium]
MSLLTRAWLGGVMLAAVLTVDLPGADAPIRFRCQSTNGNWSDWLGDGDSTGQGSGGTIAFSPDNELLLRPLDDSTLVLWQLTKKSELARLDHRGWLRFVRFSPDSRKLLVALDQPGAKAGESEIVLWDLETLTIVRRLEEGRTCWDADFSRDGGELVTSSQSLHKDDPLENKVAVWSMATGEELARLQTQKRGKEHRPNNASLDFSPDGKWLLTSANDGAIIWDAADWHRVRSLPGSADARLGRFSPDSRFVFAGCQKRTNSDPLGVRVWNVDTGKMVAATTFDISKDERGDCGFALAPDGKSLVTTASISIGSPKQHLRTIMKFWNVVSGQEMVLQSQTGKESYYFGRGARFSPDGETLAMASWQPRPEIKFVDTKYWQTQKSFDMTLPEDDQQPVVWWDVGGLRFSPDGRWFAATRIVQGFSGRELFLWQLETDGQPRADSEVEK